MFRYLNIQFFSNNMKAQTSVIREVIAFSIGLILLMSIFVLINQSFVPRVTGYSEDRMLLNILSHFKYSVYYVNTIGALGKNTEIAHVVDFPEDVGAETYQIYLESNNFCIEMKDKKFCDISDIEVTGVYYSGTPLLIEFKSNVISFGNLLQDS